MDTKKNCWEFMKCGREPDGINISTLGVCSATTYKKYNGFNNGKNAGRICWAIAGTLCNGVVQGTCATKRISCISCDFFKKVVNEESDNFHLLIPGQEIYKKEQKLDNIDLI